ncbi:kinesin light chain [Clonorchis sinensis]|uniref:Kinesin light chain n=1 Tax=Clonorchis sinensis TaxID=79923 RepID=G7YN33_CLOSI|nr:kinesin light chain [Clonorchis sinensis]
MASDDSVAKNHVETYFLKYTVNQLCKNNIMLNRHYEEELLDSKKSAPDGDHDGSTNCHKMDTCRKKIERLITDSKLLNFAASEIQLLRQVQEYMELLEICIDKTELRYNRLNEEHNWLEEELKHFEKLCEKESQKCEVLKKKIAHSAFIYNQRRSWNDHCLPVELCGLPREVTSEQGQCNQIEKTLTHMRPKLPELNHIRSDFSDLLRNANFDDDRFVSVVNDNDDQSNNQSGKIPGCCIQKQDMAEITVFHPTMALRNNSNENASNSTKLSLTQLKSLMLGDNSKESKRSAKCDVTSTTSKPKALTLREKSSRPSSDAGSDWKVSELEKDVMNQCVKIMKTLIPECQSPKGEEREETLVELIEAFVRHPCRTNRLGGFIELIHQFNHKESRSPGICLCWLAVSALKSYEKELRKGKPTVTKRSAVRTKPEKPKPIAAEPDSVPDKELYRNIVADLCRLLNLLAFLYKSRNDLTKSAECFKELLKIRRITQGWKDISVAIALQNLSSVQTALKDFSSAITNARKALQLRRDLLANDPTLIDQTGAQLGMAKQMTYLALLIMNKQQTEQRRLRYQRFPFKDAADLPGLLNEAIGIVTNLAEVYTNSLGLINDDWDVSNADAKPSNLGDSEENSPEPQSFRLNSTDECSMVARNALAIYHICTKKWNKAFRLLMNNLQHIDQVLPDERLDQVTKSHRMATKTIKLTCLKCLVYVCKMLDDCPLQEDMIHRIAKLDRYYRRGDELVEDDMIRMCLQSLVNYV